MNILKSVSLAIKRAAGALLSPETRLCRTLPKHIRMRACVPGGGAHTTTKRVKWQVVGVDADFTHSAPLDPSGNALGPFTVGQIVKIITEVSNSVGTRTTAPRISVIGEPVV